MKVWQFLRSLLVACIGAIILIEFAHSQNQQSGVSTVGWDHPITLVNYSPGQTSTIEFRGTERSVDAKGSARVRMERGTAQIEARFQNLLPPPEFGPEYTAYVLWAVTSDGKTTNLGEVTVDGKNGRIKTSVPLQAFALFVTAEPYFAIAVPSNVVAMENVRATGTRGTLTTVTPQAQLVAQGAYAAAGLNPFIWDSRPPRDLFQARNAVRIAEWQGASRYATEMYQRAEQLLLQAELSQQQRGNNRNRVIQASRQAVQLAEASRLTALQKIGKERLAIERAEAAEREAAAEASRLAATQEAEAQAKLRAEAEAARLAAAQEAERQVRLRAAAEASRLDAEAARLAAAQEAERASLAAEEARKLLAQAEAAMAKLEAERKELRSRLLKQFNTILETRDTARGLILNMGDVLFDIGKSELRQEAREKLARLSGLLLGHPTLKLAIEGHTDSTGSDDLNQTLSEQRAESVRSYLLTQSVPAESVTAKGFGETMPVASNDTPSGRQRNRRVEIVVSGEALGNPF